MSVREREGVCEDDGSEGEYVRRVIVRECVRMMGVRESM